MQCVRCQRYFKKVYSPFLPRPVDWVPCEEPFIASHRLSDPAEPAMEQRAERRWVVAGDPRLARLDSLELGVRTNKAVRSLGVSTVGQLCEKTEEDLLRLTNFGQTSLMEIRQMLASFGLNLRPSEDPIGGPGTALEPQDR
jgi:DNA-directed RNA polymerase alpha subunit